MRTTAATTTLLTVHGCQTGGFSTVTQELMRHSDPRLTAMLYTDVSQLPIFDAVESLNWLDGQNKAGDAQQSDFPCPEQSQSDTIKEAAEQADVVDIAHFSPALAATGTEGQVVLREGFEPSHLAALPPEDSVSTNSTT